MKILKGMIICLSLGIASNVYSQFVSTGFGESGGFFNDGGIKTTQSKLVLLYSDIEGSPYYSDEFVKSDIYFKDGNVKHDVYIRLNLYKNNIEFKLGSDYYILVKLDQVAKIIFLNTEFVFISKSIDNTNVGFYKVNLSGKNQILTRLSVEFTDAKVANNSYSEGTQPKFGKVKERQVVQLECEKLLYFKNKKQFYAAFSSDSLFIIDFIEKENLNPAKYNDLVKIVTYMNSQESK